MHQIDLPPSRDEATWSPSYRIPGLHAEITGIPDVVRTMFDHLALALGRLGLFQTFRVLVNVMRAGPTVAAGVGVALLLWLCFVVGIVVMSLAFSMLSALAAFVAGRASRPAPGLAVSLLAVGIGVAWFAVDVLPQPIGLALPAASPFAFALVIAFLIWGTRQHRADREACVAFFSADRGLVDDIVPRMPRLVVAGLLSGIVSAIVGAVHGLPGALTSP